MYVVTLSKRFDNDTDNLPLFACRFKKDADAFISNKIREDMNNKSAIENWFNGDFTDKELRLSFAKDYHVWPVTTCDLRLL